MLVILCVLKGSTVAAETVHFWKDAVELVWLTQVLRVASDIIRPRLIANCSRF